MVTRSFSAAAVLLLLTCVAAAEQSSSIFNLKHALSRFIPGSSSNNKVSSFMRENDLEDSTTADEVFVPFVARQVVPSPSIIVIPPTPNPSSTSTATPSPTLPTQTATATATVSLSPFVSPTISISASPTASPFSSTDPSPTSSQTPSPTAATPTASPSTGVTFSPTSSSSPSPGSPTPSPTSSSSSSLPTVTPSSSPIGVPPLPSRRCVFPERNRNPRNFGRFSRQRLDDLVQFRVNFRVRGNLAIIRTRVSGNRRIAVVGTRIVLGAGRGTATRANSRPIRRLGRRAANRRDFTRSFPITSILRPARRLPCCGAAIGINVFIRVCRDRPLRPFVCRNRAITIRPRNFRFRCRRN